MLDAAFFGLGDGGATAAAGAARTRRATTTDGLDAKRSGESLTRLSGVRRAQLAGALRSPCVGERGVGVDLAGSCAERMGTARICPIAEIGRRTVLRGGDVGGGTADVTVRDSGARTGLSLQGVLRPDTEGTLSDHGAALCAERPADELSADNGRLGVATWRGAPMLRKGNPGDDFGGDRGVVMDLDRAGGALGFAGGDTARLSRELVGRCHVERPGARASGSFEAPVRVRGPGGVVIVTGVLLGAVAMRPARGRWTFCRAYTGAAPGPALSELGGLRTRTVGCSRTSTASGTLMRGWLIAPAGLRDADARSVRAGERRRAARVVLLYHVRQAPRRRR